MIKITGTILTVAALLSTGTIFAGNKGDHACCAKNASNSQKACTDFASLGASTQQKSKLEAWQSDCMKAGCTKESRAKFLQQAKGILSADQYAKLKAECDKSATKTKA
jgi:hypothetical protein